MRISAKEHSRWRALVAARRSFARGDYTRAGACGKARPNSVPAVVSRWTLAPVGYWEGTTPSEGQLVSSLRLDCCWRPPPWLVVTVRRRVGAERPGPTGQERSAGPRDSPQPAIRRRFPFHSRAFAFRIQEVWSHRRASLVSLATGSYSEAARRTFACLVRAGMRDRFLLLSA